jgi:hypothetical protein
MADPSTGSGRAETVAIMRRIWYPKYNLKARGVVKRCKTGNLNLKDVFSFLYEAGGLYADIEEERTA